VLLVVFGVLVLGVEDGVSFGVIVLPEPLASLAGVLLVGVGALPLVKVELGGRKAEKRVRGLLGGRGILLLLFFVWWVSFPVEKSKLLFLLPPLSVTRMRRIAAS
jgi:hypothetical protein